MVLIVKGLEMGGEAVEVVGGDGGTGVREESARETMGFTEVVVGIGGGGTLDRFPAAAAAAAAAADFCILRRSLALGVSYWALKVGAWVSLGEASLLTV